MPTYLSPGVYVEEVDSGARPIEGVGTAVAAFVGLAATGPVNTPTLVSNWTQFVNVFCAPQDTDRPVPQFLPGSYLALSVYGYFMNGGGNCYVVRIGGSPAEQNGKGTRSLTAAAPQAMLGNRYRVQALDPAVAPGSIEIEVADAGGEAPTDDMFKLVVKQAGQVVEEFDRAVTGRGRQNVATMVNTSSKVIRLEEVGSGTVDKPAAGTVALLAPPPPAAVPSPALTADDYVGSAADRTGFGGLEAVDDVTIVCVPDLMSAYQQGAIDDEALKTVQLAVVTHCELMGDRVAVLDPPPNLNAQQIREWRRHKAGYDSKYATLYWPWIKVYDPATAETIFAPPSGHVAGLWGRTDDTRGVHKAPANEVLRGAVSLQTQITKTEHGSLNPEGINCIRAFPGGGIRIYGARTLSSDPAWRYLNVRRLFNYLEESILLGTQWVVFEPNDDALWARIRRTISAFLVNEWRKGALFGLTPDEAFWVKCDRETNPAEGIDAGQVVCEIGVAPVKPAEFVVFRLSQFSGGTALATE